MERKIYEEFVSANIIAVTIEHNGFRGGDSGHGGYVQIEFKNIASTDMQINGEDVESFVLRIGGDCERQTFLSAFKMIVNELETNK